MYSVDTRNVNSAYQRLLPLVDRWGVQTPTRNGLALVMQEPTIVNFRNPQERVLFDGDRNANPFFHLMEALWMLAGRNDLEFVRQFNKQMYTYSDDGVVFNGAYGYRWRKHYGYDQIARSCEMLSNNPQDRRVVLTMWDAHIDLGSKSLDIPCNQQMMLRIDTGVMQMLTTNRSNDLIWGLLGANAVHLTILQEYMAHRIGVPMGPWVHVSNNLHVYDHHWPLIQSLNKDETSHEWLPYPKPSKLVDNWGRFDKDCVDLCNGKLDYFEEPFFDGTVAPMIQAWHAWKAGDEDEAAHCASCTEAEDWRKAAVDWIQRALERKHASK